MSEPAPAKPMQFSGASIRAIQAGHKTQTRRVLTPGTDPAQFERARGYVKPGTVLWVKEAHQTLARFDHLSAGAIGRLAVEQGAPEPWMPTRYRADGRVDNGRYLDGETWGRPRHPMYMPRFVARQYLTVTACRLERLHAITEADAQAEGMRPPAQSTTRTPDEYVALYRYEWGLLNAHHAPWSSNPHVFVITFAPLPLSISSAAC